MKFRVTFKTPDAAEPAFHEAIDRAAEVLPLDEIDEQIVKPMETVIDRFVKYRELVTIEFDTVNNTAVVVPV